MFSFSVEISRVRFGIFCVSGIILGYCYRISIQKYFKCNNRKEVDRYEQKIAVREIKLILLFIKINILLKY